MVWNHVTNFFFFKLSLSRTLQWNYLVRGEIKKNQNETNFQKYFCKVCFPDTSTGDYKEVDNLYYKTWTPAKTSTKPKTLQEMSCEAMFKDL